MTINVLPPINAGLNSLSTLLLITALVLIKKGNYRAHAYTMLGALFTSTLFLISYLSYHYIAGEHSSGLHPGPLRTIYFIILFPHLLLAMVMLPMIVFVLWQAYQRNWEKHRRWAPATLGIWLYVSVTGVVIYGMLYHLFPHVIANGG